MQSATNIQQKMQNLHVDACCLYSERQNAQAWNKDYHLKSSNWVQTFPSSNISYFMPAIGNKNEEYEKAYFELLLRAYKI